MEKTSLGFFFVFQSGPKHTPMHISFFIKFYLAPRQENIVLYRVISVVWSMKILFHKFTWGGFACSACEYRQLQTPTECRRISAP